ncbi:Uncharacterised protein [uncultured archaeon]|nr:Uncharacterised protein [uncultured archaeon]
MRKTAIIIVTIALLITLVLGVFAITELDKNETKSSGLSVGLKETAYSGTGYSYSGSAYEHATVVNSYRSGSCSK